MELNSWGQIYGNRTDSLVEFNPVRILNGSNKPQIQNLIIKDGIKLYKTNSW